MTFYEECLCALGEYEELSEQASKEIINLITNKIEFTWYEKINWDKIKRKTTVTSINQLEELENRKVYLFWDNAEYPVIVAKLGNIISNWDDVECLGFRTWIVSLKFDFFLEYCDDLILGFGNE